MSKMRFEDSHSGGFFAKKGFYIALAVCLIAVGAASWTAIRTLVIPPESVTELSSRSWTSTPPFFEEADNNQSGIAPWQPPSSSVPEKSESVQQEAAVTGEEPQVEEVNAIAGFFVMPAAGQIDKRYSETELLYSKTYRDYRSHFGIDIAAERGAAVRSAGSGRVTDIYLDPLLGQTVVIDHGNSIIAYYSGLGKDVLVKKEQAVEADTVLGAVDMIPCESLDPPHIHFAMKKDGKWISPLHTMGMMN